MVTPPDNQPSAQSTRELCRRDSRSAPPTGQTDFFADRMTDVRHSPDGRWKNKWVAWFLCLFFGLAGAHKFYEENIPAGIAYLCTGGLCGIGWIVDLIILLRRPNPYRTI